MDFDPLLLFTPAPSEPESSEASYFSNDAQKTLLGSLSSGDNAAPDLDSEISDEMTYLHVHDLPLLAMKPPAEVLLVFLRLLAPDEKRNFGPAEALCLDTDAVFANKNVESLVTDTLTWLGPRSCRFPSRSLLASVSQLSETLRKAFPQEYNSWLTRIISSDLAWVSAPKAEEIKSLASLRLAENCGRTAQPELLRHIDIPSLPNQILLKEPSLTADNLGLKTWGSSLVLSTRLAKSPSYLNGSVLELGAGTGLVGMVSCLLGFATMLTDLPEILPNLQANVKLNGITNAETAVLDWSNPLAFLDHHGAVTFSTVILSDPLYSSKHPKWIVDMLNTFLSADEDARVLLQIPLRRNFEKERDHLWRLLEENKYEVEEEDYDDGYDDFGEVKFCFKKLRRCSRATA